MIISLNKINPNIFVFFSFIALFIVQDFFYKILQNSSLPLAASLFYLPHGLRVLAALISGTKILIGLFLAHFLTGLYIHFFNNLETFGSNLKTIFLIFITSLISTFCVLIAIKILKFFKNDLSLISLKTILIVSMLSALINSFFVNLIYFLMIENWNINVQIIHYFFGDIVGAVILFYIIKNFYKNVKFL